MQVKAVSAGVPGFSHFLLISILFGSLTLPAIIPGASQTHAASPITPSGLNTQVNVSSSPPPGKVQYDITGGTRPGGGANLFHSFGNFNVPNNNIANFLNETGLPTSNILGRVTGGNISNIFGMIQTTGFGNANLFLMNPAGFLFGPSATVNVGGMVAFTTADYLRLADNVRFNAVPNTAADALLSPAPVAAFGFLGSNPGAITVQGSQLTVTQGTGISLVGGNITIGSGTLDDGTVQPATFTARGGQINLASVASPGEILYPSLQTAPNVNGQSFTNMGTISISQNSLLDVSNDAAGTVRILGGQLVIDNSTISADTTNSNGAPVAIDINLTGDMSITTVDIPALTSRTTGSGNAGDIRILSKNMDVTATTLNDFIVSAIDTHTSGTGNAGNVSITTGNLNVTGDPLNFAFLVDSGTSGAGNGANVALTAEHLNFDNTFISTGDLVSGLRGEGASGSSGAVTVTANTINFNASSIITDSSTARAGNITIVGRDIQMNNSVVSAIGFDRGGDIAITANSLVTNFTSFETDTVLSPGGGISVNANVVELTNGSTLTSSTFGDGSAGNINVTATDHVSLLGSFFDERPSGIFSNSFGNSGTQGAAGSVTVTTPMLEMTGGARINTTTATSGRGGDVTINTTNTISISGEISTGEPEPLFGLGSIHPSGISTQTVGSQFCLGPCGDAGNIAITTGSLVLSSGAQLNSGTSSTGRGGNININATNGISMSGTLSDGSPVGVFSRTIGTDPGSGNGGIIELHAGQLQLTGGAQISASTVGSGNAGSVTIEGTASPAQSVLIDGAGSGISTDTQGTGAGGNISINANSVTLQNGGTLSATTSGTEPTATGGTVTIAATDVQLSNNASITTQTTGPGNAGTISITAGESVSLMGGSSISSSSPLGFRNGNGGPVTITAPTVSLQDSSIITFAEGFGSEFSTAGAGAVTINASTSLSLVNATIDSHTADTAGNAGQILITSPSVSLSNASTISSATFNGGFNPDGSPVGLPTDGNGGLVELAVGQLLLADSSQIITQTTGGGQGGSVTVHGLRGPSSKAADVTISSGAEILTNAADLGAAGNITVDTTRLTVSGGGQMQAATVGPGSGGTITIRATEQVTISGEILLCPSCSVGQRTMPSQLGASSDADGRAGNIVVQTPRLSLIDGGSIVAQTFRTGQGGTVTVQGLQGAGTSAVSFTASGQSSEGNASGIFTDTQGSGAGGNIVVNANSVTLQNGGMLSATTSGTDTSAVGGTITVNASQVHLNNGGLITAATTGAGAGGSININSGSTFASNASTVSSTAAQAQGGDITITSGQSTTLNSGSSISASSTGAGNAGNILINAGQNFTATNSSVTTQASQASGGTIKITTTPSGMVELINSTISASVLDGTGGGGSVNIDPQFVILQNSQILAQAVHGPGGNISITTNLLLPDANSVISASSQFGVNGTVTVQSPNGPASGKIIPLSQKPLTATALLSQRCAALAGGEFSSFTVAGRDSLPAEPGGWLASPLALAISESGGGTLTELGTRARAGEAIGDTPLLSLRQIAPPGFLTQAFAMEWAAGCTS